MTDLELDRDAEDDIAGEHKELLQLLRLFRELLDARDADSPALTICVDKLANVIEAHFRHEERADGHFAELLAVAPRVQHKIEALKDQHLGFLTALEGLRDSARSHSGTPHCWQAMQFQFEDFSVRFREHERMENSLVQEVYERDLGNSD